MFDSHTFIFPVGMYKCYSSSVCLHMTNLCDGWPQCPNEDDEFLCDIKCPSTCLCQGHAFVCQEYFNTEYYPQLRYVDATGTNMTLTDFDEKHFIIHLVLKHCKISSLSVIELPNLQHLDLSENQFTGSIPNSIVESFRLPAIINTKVKCICTASPKMLATVTSAQFLEKLYG